MRRFKRRLRAGSQRSTPPPPRAPNWPPPNWSANMSSISRHRRHLTWDVMRFARLLRLAHVRPAVHLFAHLQPADIGISLSASCLMYPLKSVSGVIVAAKRGAFHSTDDFPFCGDCPTHACRERIAAFVRARRRSRVGGSTMTVLGTTGRTPAAGRCDGSRRVDACGDRPGGRPEGDSRLRPDRRHDRGGGPLQGSRDLSARRAAGREGHVRRHGSAQAAHDS